MAIDIILVTEGEMIKLNESWFGKKRPTDVIAFDDGEIYISVDAAKRQAGERGVKLEQEVLRLAVHGAAHICGFNDMSLEDFCKMREKEWQLITRLL